MSPAIKNFLVGFPAAAAIYLKTMTSDLELLQEYARNKTEESFAALVNRHLNLVYSAALRQVRSPQLAEEMAQAVFMDLAQNAGKLRPDTILTAWLYQVTRRTAIDVVRRESRRQSREQIATEMNAMNAATGDWTEVEPLLDEAMDALDDTDRAAVLLRYFENKSLREVGATLGTSDDAAQKRVSRAVERLREFFAKRGVTVGASGLVVIISGNAVQAAPEGLALTISTAATVAGTAAAAATVTAAKIVGMTTLQKALVATTVAVLAGAGIYEARQASALRSRVQTLQQQEAPLAEQMQQLQRERDDTSKRLAALLAENERLKSNHNATELLRLRGELTQLKAAAAQNGSDPLDAAAKSWLDRVARLKQWSEQHSAAAIPEFCYLTQSDWLNATKTINLETDADFRRALSRLRDDAKGQFANMLPKALVVYTSAHDGQLPTDISQLQPYFASPVDNAIFERYRLVHTGKVDSLDEPLVTEKARVDEDYDSLVSIAINHVNYDHSTNIPEERPAPKSQAP